MLHAFNLGHWVNPPVEATSEEEPIPLRTEISPELREAILNSQNEEDTSIVNPGQIMTIDSQQSRNFERIQIRDYREMVNQHVELAQDMAERHNRRGLSPYETAMLGSQMREYETIVNECPKLERNPRQEIEICKLKYPICGMDNIYYYTACHLVCQDYRQRMCYRDKIEIYPE